MKIIKENSLIILFGVIIVTIIFVIVFMTFSSLNDNGRIEEQERTITPSPTATTPASPTSSPLFYNQEATDRMFKVIENRPAISTDDNTIKQTIIARLPSTETSGIVYTSEAVQIEYVQPANAMIAEIRIINITQAKEEATKWFLAQGMTQDGICKLPLVFYINWEVSKQLESLDIVFNPLAPGC